MTARPTEKETTIDVLVQRDSFTLFGNLIQGLGLNSVDKKAEPQRRLHGY
ncbi:hypothetical protein Hdeb2414_s0006g00211851 [Helianthus debilis subsp. tardiflorus]